MQEQTPTENEPAPDDQTTGEAVAEAVEAVQDDLASESSALAELVDTDTLREMLAKVTIWSRTELLTINSAIQLALVFGALVPAVLFGPRLKEFVQRHLRKRAPKGILQRVCDAIATLATPIAAFFALTLFSAILGDGMGQQAQFVDAAQSLLAAWIVVRLVTLAIRSPFWSRVAFYVVWPIAVLDSFGLLGGVFQWMRDVSLVISPETATDPAVALTLYDVLRAGIIFAIFMQLAGVFSSVVVGQVQQTDEINASLKALIAKIINFVMPIIALLLALQFIGFNLASLAIFSGAIGLGIGLGLQKIIGNFLAGFTLLADRSIKPGDTIQVDDTFGWVTDMKSRYVSIRTRDGTEHLIPNSTFIEEGVVNWSHKDQLVRVHAPFGVAYGTKDLRRVQDIAIEAAKSTERVQAGKPPVCNLMEFGDNSVNFDLRFWIIDPPNGISNVRSAVLMKIWDAFQEEGIEIPFPQRDLHIKSSDVPFVAEHRTQAD